LMNARYDGASGSVGIKGGQLSAFGRFGEESGES